MNRIGGERGWPPASRAHFEHEAGPRGALCVGSPATVAAKIVQAMSTPFSFEQQTLRVTTSIGLAFYQGGTTTAHTLIKQADEMLYQAKGAGRNNVQMALRVVEGGRT